MLLVAYCALDCLLAIPNIPYISYRRPDYIFIFRAALFDSPAAIQASSSDHYQGSSLSFQSQYIDIYSCSWGPYDDGATLEGPGVVASR